MRSRLQTMTGFSLALALFVSLGCRGDVTTTPDSTKIELEVPKVEMGKEKIDLDPRTDGDIDIDTPKPGDS